MAPTKKRIQQDFRDLQKNLPLNCVGVDMGKNIHKWEAIIVGPQNTVYEGGIFKLAIEIPDEYPIKPPKVTFKTRIYHPNIDQNGGICADIFKPQGWSPAYNMFTVIGALTGLLEEPNPSDPLVDEIARVYQKDRVQFDVRARQWTARYAV